MIALSEDTEGLRVRAADLAFLTRSLPRIFVNTEGDNVCSHPLTSAKPPTNYRVNFQYPALGPQTKYLALPEFMATAHTRKEARSSLWKLVSWLCQKKLKTKASLVR